MDELKASGARQAQRTDELRGGLNRQMNGLRDDMKQLRADNRSLGEKMDRLLDILATAQQT